MIIPYTEADLICELKTLAGSYSVDEKKLERINDEAMKLVSKNKSELNQQVAEHNGISVDTLISSSNYNLLVTEYREQLVNIFIKKLVDELDITLKQAWAIFALAIGFLKL